MSTLGKAVIEFSADTAKFGGDVDAAGARFNKAMGVMEAGAQKLAGVLAAAFSVEKIRSSIQGAIDQADQLNKLNQKIGVSVERLSELKLAAELSDVSFEAFGKGLRAFNLSLVEAQDSSSKAGQLFKALGVDITAGPDKAFRQFAEAMSKLEDGELKTAAAMEILKKAGAEMIPMLNGGAKGLDDTAEKARKLGLLIGTDFARNAESFNDNMKLLSKGAESMGIALAEKGAGALVTISTNLLDAKMKGDLLSASLLEVARVAAVVASLMPGITPLGAFGNWAAPKLFGKSKAEEERDRIQGAIRAGTARLTGPQASPVESAAPNVEQVACAASGGKWVNGKCERSGAGAAKKVDDGMAAYAASIKAQDDVLHEAEELGRKFIQQNDQQLQQERERLMLIKERADEMYYLGLQAQMDARDELLRHERLKKVAATQRELARDAQELGAAFATAFEDAALGGRKLSDVLKGLSMDIARLITRKTITDPLAKAAGGLLENFSITKLLGIGIGGGDAAAGVTLDGRAAGGSVFAGTGYIVGENGPEYFRPLASGSIVSNEGLGRLAFGADGPEVNIGGDDNRSSRSVVNLTQNIHVSGNGVTMADVARAMGATQRSTLRAVAELRKR